MTGASIHERGLALDIRLPSCGRPLAEQAHLYRAYTAALYAYSLPIRYILGKAQPMHTLDLPLLAAHDDALDELRRRLMGLPLPASAPEFDKRLTNGARVKLTRKGRDEVHEFTVVVVVRNGARIIAVRPSADGHRYDASDYDLTIVRPALPTEPGLYVSVDAALDEDEDESPIYYRLDEAGRWTRWDVDNSYLESTTAYTVGTEAGPAGLVELVAVR